MKPLPCTEVPRGNGFCDMCAAGAPEKCRYTQPLKKCSKCKLVWARSEFSPSTTKSDGLQSYCKNCRREYAKENKPKNLSQETVEALAAYFTGHAVVRSSIELQINTGPNYTAAQQFFAARRALGIEGYPSAEEAVEAIKEKL